VDVRLAKTAGFCMGVRLAMEKVLTIAEQCGGPIYTCGPLIHNRQAVEMLEGKGVRNLDEHPDACEGTAVVRAHGVPREVRGALRSRGFDVVDATCPHVLASQRHIEQFTEKGYTIVIAGDRDHAEVEGLRSHAREGCAVVGSPDEARRVPLEEPVCLIAQTTFNETVYEEIAEALRARVEHIEVVQSICRATHRRQEEVLRLAREVEAMVVVGGLHSANTRRLAEIARSSGIPTFHVETADDLDLRALAQFRLVGLTAGASTPNWVTRSVLQALEDAARPMPRLRWLAWCALAILTRSNVYSAIAGASLTYACVGLAWLDVPPLPFVVATFCYVFAVTTLNRVSPHETDARHLPPRVAFYRQHARPLAGLSLAFCLGSLLTLAFVEAWWSMGLLALAYALGAAYSIRFVPQRWRRALHFARLRDLPASKDLLIALGWTVVCVLVPSMAAARHAMPAVLAACVLAFALTFVKATMMDLGDVQEDRLLGRETLPILLGEATTRWLMTAAAAFLAVVLAASAAAGATSPLAWALLGCPVGVLGALWLCRHLITGSDVTCVLAADGALMLAGLVALAWTCTGAA